MHGRSQKISFLIVMLSAEFSWNSVANNHFISPMTFCQTLPMFKNGNIYHNLLHNSSSPEYAGQACLINSGISSKQKQQLQVIKECIHLSLAISIRQLYDVITKD